MTFGRSFRTYVGGADRDGAAHRQSSRHPPCPAMGRSRSFGKSTVAEFAHGMQGGESERPTASERAQRAPRAAVDVLDGTPIAAQGLWRRSISAEALAQDHSNWGFGIGALKVGQWRWARSAAAAVRGRLPRNRGASAMLGGASNGALVARRSTHGRPEGQCSGQGTSPEALRQGRPAARATGTGGNPCSRCAAPREDRRAWPEARRRPSTDEVTERWGEPRPAGHPPQ